MNTLRQTLDNTGLIAILRGIGLSEARTISGLLYGEGFRIIEVPLNTPCALEAIREIRSSLPPDCLVGAGTVLRPADVKEVREAGGELIVMPHSDPLVIRAGLACDMEVLPGVATPHEAFAALAQGIDLLKVFPADHLGPSVLRSWLAVLPAGVGLVPVGSITPGNLPEFTAAGAVGLGIGSALYKPGLPAPEVARRARQFTLAWEARSSVSGVEAARDNIQEKHR